MPVFRSKRTLDIARNLKILVHVEGGITRGTVPDVELHEGRSEDPKNGQVTHG